MTSRMLTAQNHIHGSGAGADAAAAGGVGESRKGWRPLIGYLLLGAICRLAFAVPLPYATAREVDVSRPGDQGRFLSQGLWLSQGRGYLNLDGQTPCTSLPPGYPAFLAVLLSIRDSTQFVVAVQFVLSLASIALIYTVFAALPGRPTLWPCLLMAGFPWLAVTATQIMSEGLGIFLTSLIAWLAIRLQQDRFGPGLGLLAGLVAVYACLVVPAVAFCMVGIWSVMFVRRLRRPATALALAIGGLTVMVPWQWHAYRATGKLVPQLLTPIERSYYGTSDWVRTWAYSPAEFMAAQAVYISPNTKPDYSLIPDRAFPDARTRAEAERRAAEWRIAAGGWRANDSGELYRPVDEYLAGVASERNSDRLRYQAVPALARAWNLWWMMPDVGMIMSKHVGRLWPGNIADQFRDGARRGILRLGLSAVCAFALALHVAVLGYFAWGAVRAVRRPAWIPVAVIAGVVIYTLISAASVYVESRRNLPFYPLLLLVVWSGWRANRVRAASAD